jgi:hypothetical protein
MITTNYWDQTSIGWTSDTYIACGSFDYFFGVSNYSMLHEYIAHWHKVCGERYRLARIGRRICSVTVIVEKTRIRSPTWSKRLAKSALALAVNLQVFGFPHIAPGCAN